MPPPCLLTCGSGGALAYPAAYDVHRARALGRREPRTGIIPFLNLITQQGMSQRVKMAPVHDPPVLLLDEPLHGMDLPHLRALGERQKRLLDRRQEPFPPRIETIDHLANRLRVFEDPLQRHSASGSSPPPTWTICWYGSSATHPPTDKKPYPARRHTRQHPPDRPWES